jgi:hypothetical protein
MKKYSIIPFTLLCLWLQCYTIYAQEETTEEEGFFNWESLIYENDGFSLSTATYLMGAKTYNTLGPLPLKTRLGYGFYASLNYWVSFNKTFGFEVGFSAGAIPLNFHYNDPINPNSNYFSDKTSTSFGLFNFPIHLVTRTRISQKIFGFLKTGINLRHAGFGVSNYNYGAVIISDTSRLTAIGANFQIPESKFRVNYSFKLGIDKVLSNFDLLSISLIYNHSPRVIINGSYEFFPKSAQFQELHSKGIYQTKGSYVGIEVAYSLTGAGKKLRQIKAIGRKARRERD